MPVKTRSASPRKAGSIARNVAGRAPARRSVAPRRTDAGGPRSSGVSKTGLASRGVASRGVPVARMAGTRVTKQRGGGKVQAYGSPTPARAERTARKYERKKASFLGKARRARAKGRPKMKAKNRAKYARPTGSTYTDSIPGRLDGFL